jgi:ribulose-phosphate 3-epimerase
MTVNPGFGGQAFMPDVLEKIKFTRDTCTKLNIRQRGVVPQDDEKGKVQLPPFDIQVDGGIDAQTGLQCVQAGANVLVSGTYLFKSPSMKEGVTLLKNLEQKVVK